jgi:hypothetical protein
VYYPIRSRDSKASQVLKKQKATILRRINKKLGILSVLLSGKCMPPAGGP